MIIIIKKKFISIKARLIKILKNYKLLKILIIKKIVFYLNYYNLKIKEIFNFFIY